MQNLIALLPLASRNTQATSRSSYTITLSFSVSIQLNHATQYQIRQSLLVGMFKLAISLFKSSQRLTLRWHMKTSSFQANLIIIIFIMRQVSRSSFLTIFSPSESQPLWEPLNQKTSPELLLYQGQFYTFTGSHWTMDHYELYPDILVKDAPEQLCMQLQGILLKRLKPTEMIGQHKYGLSFERGSQKVQLFQDSVEKFNIWYCIDLPRHDHLKRLCILPNFDKRHNLTGKVKHSNNYFDCYKLINGQQFQVRIIEKAQIQNLRQLTRELRILRHLNHKNVQRLLEVYEDQYSISILFDYFLGHSLKSKIGEFSSFNEKQIAEVCQKLLSALAHIHSRGIIHKDIRPENIIFPSSKALGNPIIANFAISELKTSTKRRKIFCPGFMAPELFIQRNYDEKIDVFSLGVIFYALFFQQYPFEGKDYRETQLLNEKCEVSYDRNTKFSQSAIELLKSMLHKDPRVRISSMQATKHHWFINKRLREAQRNSVVHPTLSTIAEKSEFDHSQQIERSRTISKFRMGTQESRFRAKSVESVFHHEMNAEHDAVSVSQKIQHLNQSTSFHPSKASHR